MEWLELIPSINYDQYVIVESRNTSLCEVVCISVFMKIKEYKYPLYSSYLSCVRFFTLEDHDLFHNTDDNNIPIGDLSRTFSN